MPWLVDGDNLLGTWPGRERSDQGRRQLVQVLDRWSRATGRRLVVVFDGPERPVPPPGPGLAYAGAGRSADDWILEFLRRQPQPRAWHLVTSDRSLGDRARVLGARVEPCHRFRARLREETRPAELEEEKPRGPVPVKEWLRYFGMEDDTPDA